MKSFKFTEQINRKPYFKINWNPISCFKVFNEMTSVVQFVVMQDIGKDIAATETKIFVYQNDLALKS